jgi:hypothetical protein
VIVAVLISDVKVLSATSLRKRNIVKTAFDLVNRILFLVKRQSRFGMLFHVFRRITWNTIICCRLQRQSGNISSKSLKSLTVFDYKVKMLLKNRVFRTPLQTAVYQSVLGDPSEHPEQPPPYVVPCVPKDHLEHNNMLPFVTAVREHQFKITEKLNRV